MLGRTGVTALALLAALLTATGCSREQPVLNVQDHPLPPSAQQLSLDDIGQKIIVAGRAARWHITPVGPGQLRGEFDDRKHEAVIDISYSQTAYSINLASSNNLHQEGDEIHKSYNKWVRSLEAHIDRSLARSGSEER